MADIAVLMGGVSSEREVSLSSGRHVVHALEMLGLAPRAIDVGADIATLVADLTPKPDKVFNALHGRWGEDGTIQGLLELMQIPYTHSGVRASSLAMHKMAAQECVSHAGIVSPDSVVMTAAQLGKDNSRQFPYVIKPLAEGSSVGVTIVRDAKARDAALKTWKHGDIMVQDYIAGSELTVGIVKNRALEVMELSVAAEFYDYHAKYEDARTEYHLPANISHATRKQVMAWGEAAHYALGCCGATRVDFRYDAQADRLYFLELNTQPGLTEHSLLPRMAQHAGMDFNTLISWMLEEAQCGAA